MVEETRDEFSSLSIYEAFTCYTKFNIQSEIDDIVNRYSISDHYMCYLPTKSAGACNAN